MAKRKKATLSIGKLVTVLLLAVSVILWFALPAIKLDSEHLDSTFSFLNMAFGKHDKGALITLTYFEFSILNLIPLVLLALALVLSVLDLLMKKKLFSNINLVTAALAILGGGLLFLVKTLAKTDLNMENYILHIGVYASAIPAILAGLAGFVLK
ncbi:MAG TPA: hypothetical protein VFD05_03090 [Bacilli bacterium]|nr:hypothetical protein [Bacilli bacterium]